MAQFRQLSVVALTSALVTGGALAGVKVKVTDPALDPGGAFLAYTEFELSGEPLAEAMGLDLDVLDPDVLDKPTVFDYAAGIESYEYSEEAMYALNYQSGMGLHLANGLRNTGRGGSLAKLGERFIALAGSVGISPSEIPLNLYPLALPYRMGEPSFATEVDETVVNRDGDNLIPAFYRDYASLRWQPETFVRELNPAAIGGIWLKEVMWSQDFLGGMHTVEGDEEVEATSSDMDKDGTHALGVSAIDGLNGVMLTEISLEKMRWLTEKLAWDGKALGVRLQPDYDASRPVWFPHRIGVTEKRGEAGIAFEGLKVVEGHSGLRDTWMLLWPAAEFLAFTDQREGVPSANPAFRAVFDGAPFTATAKVNRDADLSNDVAGRDGFALANTVSRVLFRNLKALHFDPHAGTLVDRWLQGRGDSVTTFDAAYALAALGVFQKAIDALPVGYASAEAGAEGLKTSLGAEALALMKKQGDFILKHLRRPDGLYADGAVVSSGRIRVQDSASVDTQFAVIRGLGALFAATSDMKYREAARALWQAIETKMWRETGYWAPAGKDVVEYTPYTAAAISGGLRTALLQLRNEGEEKAAALEPAALVERYVRWFRTVINGPAMDQGMQRAEWLGDSGENMTAQGGVDADGDHVPSITGAGATMVMANRVRIEP